VYPQPAQDSTAHRDLQERSLGTLADSPDSLLQISLVFVKHENCTPQSKCILILLRTELHTGICKKDFSGFWLIPWILCCRSPSCLLSMRIAHLSPSVPSSCPGQRICKKDFGGFWPIPQILCCRSPSCSLSLRIACLSLCVSSSCPGQSCALGSARKISRDFSRFHGFSAADLPHVC
jgi:hypothetical protein